MPDPGRVTDSAFGSREAAAGHSIVKGHAELFCRPTGWCRWFGSLGPVKVTCV